MPQYEFRFDTGLRRVVADEAGSSESRFTDREKVFGTFSLQNWARNVGQKSLSHSELGQELDRLSKGTFFQEALVVNAQELPVDDDLLTYVVIGDQEYGPAYYVWLTKDESDKWLLCYYQMDL